MILTPKLDRICAHTTNACIFEEQEEENDETRIDPSSISFYYFFFIFLDLFSLLSIQRIFCSHSLPPSLFLFLSYAHIQLYNNLFQRKTFQRIKTTTKNLTLINESLYTYMSRLFFLLFFLCCVLLSYRGLYCSTATITTTTTTIVYQHHFIVFLFLFMFFLFCYCNFIVVVFVVLGRMCP